MRLDTLSINRIATKFIGICVLLLISISPLVAEVEINYQQVVRLVLGEMDDIIENSDSQQLKNSWALPFSEFKKNNLVIQIVQKEDSTILSSANFSFFLNALEKPELITVDEKLLTLFPHKKSIIMSILMHEFQHAYDYYKNATGFIRSNDNQLERYLYEMDALYLEALFIYELVNRGYSITPFEKFILDSFHENNLQSASVILRGVDRSQIYFFYGKRRLVETSEHTLDQFLKSIIDLGTELLNVNISDTNWKTYNGFVSIKTYDQFVAALVNPVLDEKALEDYKEEIEMINAIKEELQDKYLSENKRFLMYQETIHNRMISDIGT